MTEFTKQYTDLMILQYHDKIKAKSHIEVLANSYESLFNLYESFNPSFSLDTAIGKQLNTIGKIVGITRNIPSIVIKNYFAFDGVTAGKTFGEGRFFSINENPYTDYEMDDDLYRFYINAKVINNFVTAKLSTGNFSIQQAVDNLFENKGIIVDNRDMTFTIWVKESFEIDKIKFIEMLNLYPLPCGTIIKEIWIYPDDVPYGNTSTATLYEGI